MLTAPTASGKVPAPGPLPSPNCGLGCSGVGGSLEAPVSGTSFTLLSRRPLGAGAAPPSLACEVRDEGPAGGASEDPGHWLYLSSGTSFGSLIPLQSTLP